MCNYPPQVEVVVYDNRIYELSNKNNIVTLLMKTCIDITETLDSDCINLF